jgi:MoaA/NifB/PqqE/SkfB family radical SAM enzyme
MHITTNGQSPHKAQELAKEVLKRGIIPVINVSIDGPREVHDSLRGKPGAYDSGIETFRLLKALKRGHYFISCTISDYNVEHLDGLVTSLRTDIPGFSYSDLHFNLFHASPHYYQNDDVDSSLGKAYIALGRHLRKAVNGNFIKRMLEERYLRGLSAYLTSGRSPIRCQALGSTCFIDPYGNVYPCGMYGQVVGNLPECGYDMARLWNSEAASTVRSGIEREQCRGCWSPCEAYPALLGNLRRALSIKQEP